MRNYENELNERVNWIKNIVKSSNAKGIIFGNSGGKDSALVGLLAKKATDNVLGVIMPCETKQNYNSDMEHAKLLAEMANIKTITVDLTNTKASLKDALKNELNIEITSQSANNINPRLRMTALYALGQSLGYLVCGTGNRSEIYMGYYTKWGDGACDLNPIGDLFASEIFDFLKFLKAPSEIIGKKPSAGLFEGQTDEMEMGVSYDSIDEYIKTGKGSAKDIEIIEKAHKITEHKRTLVKIYPNE